ncbi:OsmC family protein [Candidatus Phytoplasma pini]|uniref:OsmC family peroxiredoxin n=1 Tax=Candidatus Phytoplasma pini TaxID=267362 RepID=A0A559KJ94_9MOLU|nr:OsmC family protein [Candidatus Phytoplasma pini]TVY12204.1 hypothetical protein MDPP_00272 [Candidatus Phytoplasma pini]
MNNLEIIVYYEPNFEDLGIIKNGLRSNLKSILTNNNGQYLSPKELFCLSLVICFYKTIKKNFNMLDIKIKVDCKTCLDQQKNMYFNINLFCGIPDFSNDKIKEIMELAHKKCPISKMLNQYPYIKLYPVSYDEIKINYL